MKKKTNQEHPMISCSSDQLGLSEFLQVDFTTRIQDRIDPHTYPAMIFIVQSHFYKKVRSRRTKGKRWRRMYTVDEVRKSQACMGMTQGWH